MKIAVLPVLLVLLNSHSGEAAGNKELIRILEERSTQFVTQAESLAQGSSPDAFKYFSELVIQELKVSGDSVTAAQLRRSLTGQYNVSSRNQLAWMIHTYAREFYQDEIIAATSELIQFRTFATNVPNRRNPEFIRQKE